jgi:serine/threonine-protein kinase
VSLPPDSDREQRLDEVLAGYLQAVRAGNAPSRAQLLDSHPDLASDLAEFFADQDRFDCLAAPLRDALPSSRRTIPSRPPGIQPGAEFGPFELLGEIARGGMGAVFRARHKGLNRVVALKLLLGGPLASEDDRARFRREAEAVARLDHPHIIPIYEVGEHDGQPFFSMKLAEAGSLAGVLGALLSRPRDSARLVERVARAVHHAHQRGILHRDLKPANVLLASPARQGREKTTPGADAAGLANAAELAGCEPLVSDFGLAREVNGPGLTQSGALVGTPAYMAPEQAAGARDAVTVATDVYGLGAVLYECLAGRPPFRGVNTAETIRQVLDCDPVAPRTLNRGVPRDLEIICLKCLHKDPQRRYASAQALADDLERFLAGEPIRARPVGRLERGVRWARRQPVVAGLSLALVVAVLSGFGLVLHYLRLAEAAAAHAQDKAELADKHRLQAEEQAREARKQAREARFQKAAADASFRQAHGTVNDFCVYLAGELEHVPGLEPIRRRLLQAARKYYEGFLEQRGKDPALRQELADTLMHVARIASSIGARGEAGAAEGQAVAIYRELHREDPTDLLVQRKLAGAISDLALTQELRASLATSDESIGLFEHFLTLHPDDPELRHGLAHVLGNRGSRCIGAGRFAEAQDNFERALVLLDRLLREYPRTIAYLSDQAHALENLGVLLGRQEGGRHASLCCYQKARAVRTTLARSFPRDPRRQADLAASHHALGICLRDLGNRAEAKAAFAQALAARRQLAAQNPLVIRYQADLAGSLTNQGINHNADGQRETGLTCLEQARVIHEKLVRIDPGSAGLRKLLGENWFNIGTTQGALKRRPQEGEAFQKARAIQEELVRQEPDDIEHRANLGRTLNNLAINLWVRNRVPEFRQVIEQALDNARFLVKRQPAATVHRQLLNAHLGVLAEVEWRLGRAKESVDATLVRRKLWPDRGWEWYRAGAEIARAAGVVGKREKALTPALEAEKRRYLDLAMDSLRGAASLGFRDAGRLRRDPDLAALRDRADFRALLAELGPGDIPKKP